MMLKIIDSLTVKSNSNITLKTANYDNYTDLEFKYKEIVPNSSVMSRKIPNEAATAAKNAVLFNPHNYRNRIVYSYNNNQQQQQQQHHTKCCNQFHPYMNGTSTSNYFHRHIFGEVFLIILILSLWVASVFLCMSKYSKLRSLQPLPTSSAGPMNIEDVQIIKNEQDTIIYKKRKGRPLHKNACVVDNLLISNINETVAIARKSNIRSSSEPFINRIDETPTKTTPNMSNVYYLASIDRSPFVRKVIRNDTKFQQRNTIDLNQTITAYNTALCRFDGSLDHTNEFKIVSINDKRNLFASSRRRYYIMNEYRKLVDKKFSKRNFSTRASSSQQDSRQDSLNNNNSNNSNENNKNLLNPNWIPVQVRRSLLQLHSQSRRNLSKSDSNLKPSNTSQKTRKLFCSQRSNEENAV